MESIDPANLKDVNKGFNKPGEYAQVLERLAKRNVYAITSFIFGMDNDTVGVAERTLSEVRTWPPGLPIFGLLTPLPGTPLYTRLDTSGRLTRRKHWQEFIPFAMAHTPLKMTVDEAHDEVGMYPRGARERIQRQEPRRGRDGGQSAYRAGPAAARWKGRAGPAKS